MPGHFELHSRIRTLVDAPALLPGGFAAPAGTPGTVTGLPFEGCSSYGVVLDGDPGALPTAYEPHEIASASEGVTTP